MANEREWFADTLKSVFSRSHYDEAGKAFADMAKLIDERNDTVADSLERISRELDG